MKNTTRYVGLDVHKDSIYVAVGEPDGTCRSLGSLPNDPQRIARLMGSLGPAQNLSVCYEAGPCGFVLYDQLQALGIRCLVAAPTLIPTRPGERVKTDSKDALKLVRCLRNGDLQPAYVPQSVERALRELIRAREAALKDRTRARTRLKLMMLRWGLKPEAKLTKWSGPYLDWIQTLRRESRAEQLCLRDALAQVVHQGQRVAELENQMREEIQQAPPELQAVIEALTCLRGVEQLTAATVAVEAGDLKRFDKAPQLMSYAGLVPSEHSSGGPSGQRRGGITKTGNAHIRRVVLEAAWSYSKPIARSGPVQKRRQGQDPLLQHLGAKADKRLRSKYLKLGARGKPANKTITAVGRELLGFMWALAKAAGTRPGTPPPQQAASS